MPTDHARVDGLLAWVGSVRLAMPLPRPSPAPPPASASSLIRRPFFSPVRIIGALVLLYFQLGIAAITAVAFLVLLLPVQVNVWLGVFQDALLSLLGVRLQG